MSQFGLNKLYLTAPAGKTSMQEEHNRRVVKQGRCDSVDAIVLPFAYCRHRYTETIRQDEAKDRVSQESTLKSLFSEAPGKVVLTLFSKPNLHWLDECSTS